MLLDFKSNLLSKDRVQKIVDILNKQPNVSAKIKETDMYFNISIQIPDDLSPKNIFAIGATCGWLDREYK